MCIRDSSTSQDLKEQYWKRTYGPVRTALEKSLEILDYYDFEMEMGHKEVGGVKSKLTRSGHHDHIMEQLEIDWKSVSYTHLNYFCCRTRCYSSWAN